MIRVKSRLDLFFFFMKKIIFTSVILLIYLLLWVIPSNVAYLIAQNRDILLGRYSEARFSLLIFLTLLNPLVLYIIWSNRENRRKRLFQVITLFVSLTVALIILDLCVRKINTGRYVFHKSYYHRAPDTIIHGIHKDIPDKSFSYLKAPPGFPDINYTLSTDKRGFRNKTRFEKYDIVMLGDSFTEGSGVSDAQSWPFLIAQETGHSVYNLGMSGGNPVTYLETLKKFGIELAPKTVICMLYEGNDFRSSNFLPDKRGFFHDVSLYIKRSPLRRTIKKFLIKSFGTTYESSSSKDTAEQKALDINSVGRATIDALSWLPLAIPEGQGARYYTFTVKRLLSHYVVKDDFLQSEGCRYAFDYLRKMKEILDRDNIRFIIVYASDKPHTLLPIIEKRVSPGNLHAFMALKKRSLPPAEKLKEILLNRLDVKEKVVKDFCRQESIEFISLTDSLRKNIKKGRQAYFTYDQHWTPIGHEIVAKEICPHVWDTEKNKISQAHYVQKGGLGYERQDRNYRR